MMATRLLNKPHRRNAFTLIELLIVIVILGILAGLILPAIGRVRNTVRIGQVKTEITALESAIATFKGKFGVDPPSRIVLYETPSAAGGWTNAAPSTDAIDSRAKIRQIWPQFDFSMVRNLNGNGVSTDVVELTQGECLVFFLGGILQRPEDANNNGTYDAGDINDDGNGKLDVNATIAGATSRSVCTGFSKNPFNPFASGGNRETAIYDFNTSRLVDVDSDGMAEFVDPLPSQTRPYLYLSSYEGIGYQSVEFGGGGPICPYLQSSSTTAPASWAAVLSIPRWKPKSYQIISPGFDKQYGTFGPFAPEVADGQLSGARDVENDNITNFHSGTLGR